MPARATVGRNLDVRGTHYRGGMDSASVVAVVVAYNRRELLLECLAGLAAQSRSVDRIVVVDNASTDGTAEAVRAACPDADLVTLMRNTGGAGGFAVGIERAVEGHAADLVWIMDDDTVPTATALEESLRAWEAHPELTLVASRAIWIDGSEHPMNTPKRRIGASREATRRARDFGAIPVRSASFVSMLLSASAVRQHGLPVADYFIWNDDFEYSTRLLRRGEGWYVPASTVVHKTKSLGSSDADPGDRFYFEVRNKLWIFRFARGLTWWESPLYWAATARRWIRTWRNSTDRAVLSDAGSRGWREGWRTRPRPNSEVLADAH
jgi:GT2 family glycosyltransferase